MENGTKSLTMSQKRAEELQNAEKGFQGYGNPLCSLLSHWIRGCGDEMGCRDGE